MYPSFFGLYIAINFVFLKRSLQINVHSNSATTHELGLVDNKGMRPRVLIDYGTLFFG
jgi:hypothetical protein